jgi:hypothetical protein
MAKNKTKAVSGSTKSNAPKGATKGAGKTAGVPGGKKNRKHKRKGNKKANRKADRLPPADVDLVTREIQDLVRDFMGEDGVVVDGANVLSSIAYHAFRKYRDAPLQMMCRIFIQCILSLKKQNVIVVVRPTSAVPSKMKEGTDFQGVRVNYQDILNRVVSQILWKIGVRFFVYSVVSSEVDDSEVDDAVTVWLAKNLGWLIYSADLYADKKTKQTVRKSYWHVNLSSSDEGYIGMMLRITVDTPKKSQERIEFTRRHISQSQRRVAESVAMGDSQGILKDVRDLLTVGGFL